MPGKTKKAGRPRLLRGEAKSIVLQARVQPDERKLFERAAKAAGLTLSDWIRETLTRSLAPQKS